jgi:hypothetical protein
MNGTRRTLWMAAGLLATVAGGCGYTTESLWPENVDSVAVPAWQRGRDIYRRGVEMRITEAVVKHIETKTPYKVLERGDADTELSGTVERIVQTVMSYNPDTGRPREIEMTVYASFTWKDLRTGRILLRRQNYPVSGTYITHEPFGRDFFQGSEGVIDDLARRVVEQMQHGWPDRDAPAEE